MSDLARLDAARAVLRRYGVRRCEARPSGIAGEVLLLGASRAEERLLLGSPDLLEALRATGFRYVALDLAPPEECP